MTTERLRELLELATENYQIIKERVPEETEVVFVSSRDISSAVIADNDLNFRTVDGQTENTGLIAAYNGVDVYCINEEEASEFFAPAVFCREGFVDYAELCQEDFIIFKDNDDDRLYRLVRRDPTTMYSDTGFTVSALNANFVPVEYGIDRNGLENLTNLVIDRVDNIVFRNNDDIRIVHEGVDLAEAEPQINIIAEGERPFRIRWDEPLTFTTTSAQFNETVWDELIRGATASFELNSIAKVAENDNEEAQVDDDIQEGDTELLDEFLDSFKKK